MTDTTPVEETIMESAVEPLTHWYVLVESPITLRTVWLP